MRPTWDDVNARVRGLGSHLLSPEQLSSCASRRDLASLAENLRRVDVVTGELPPVVHATDLDLAIRRWAGGALTILARWVGPRHEALPFVLAEIDRRSIRAMLRGAAQRAPAAERLTGVMPTPDLPQRALEELARAPTATAVIARLAAWHHPFAPGLTAGVGVAEPELFLLEAALAREVAAQAERAARRAGDRTLRGYVLDSIDLANAVTAIVLATDGQDVVPSAVFLAGGRRLGFADFAAAIASHETGAAGVRVARALEGIPCGDLFRRIGMTPAELEDALLRCRLRAVARQARMAPLGPIVVIHFALRLQTQVIDLCRIVWTTVLHAPREHPRGLQTAGAR